MDDIESNFIDKAVAEGGAYDVIRKRLLEQGRQLKAAVKQLNDRRIEEFGGSKLEVSARFRVRTQNNCIPRDIVQVGDDLLFGYNVFIGLKTETKVEDVFAIFSIQGDGENIEIHEKPFQSTFLNQTNFINDFSELYRYYKNTRLSQLVNKNGKLLASFQIGERLEDIRVFRWSISADGKEFTYIDNRGERDIQPPPTFDFEWCESNRDDIVHGRHPHINVLDKVFVETVNGTLTIKIENNTEDGLGIYQEQVDDKNQSLDDAEFHFAEVGSLILLKILPYQEKQARYFIFNSLTEQVMRMDAIGSSCVQLPEDHGIVFPGGYYLQTGEYKQFDDEALGMHFKRMIPSPNGEDVLFIFYERKSGLRGLFAYNLINKSMQNPIYGDGYALADDGRLVIFAAQKDATRVHPMQVWNTPFYSDEYSLAQTNANTFLGRIGNVELVRGVSDLFSLSRIIDNQSISVKLYEELGRSAAKIFDDFHWVESEELGEIAANVKKVAETAELAIDEFEKVESIRKQSVAALSEAKNKQADLISKIKTASWDTVDKYVDALDALRKQRGHITTLKEYRYIDIAQLEGMEKEALESQDILSANTVNFLAKDSAMAPYQEKVERFDSDIANAESTVEIEPIIQAIEETTQGLDLLSDLMSSLKVQDPNLRTQIIDVISEIYAKLNQSKANAKIQQKSFGSAEAVAQFGARFKLFSQSITNALGLSDSPEACDEQMSRLLIQLEDLESQFVDYDEFLADIVSKREEIYETFEAHKQKLLDEQQRKSQSLVDAADRILSSIDRRANKFNDIDELNTYFGSDALVTKISDFVIQLRELNAAVKADDVEAKLKGIREQAVRTLRDKSEIYEGGGNVIKLGPRHRFSVNTQELDLTIIPRHSNLYMHLSGTDYFELISDNDLNQLKDFWEVTLASESACVCRAEYLAYCVLNDARQGSTDFDYQELKKALLSKDELVQLVRKYAAPRYKEGYEKGIHDHDAALILEQLIPALERADLLIFDPTIRALAQVFWANLEKVAHQLKGSRLSYQTWRERSLSAAQMEVVFASRDAAELIAGEIRTALTEFLQMHPIPVDSIQVARAADYLVAELGRDRVEFISSQYAQQLVNELKRTLDDGSWRRYQTSLEEMLGWPAERWQLSVAWLEALVNDKELFYLKRYIPEAAALINSDERLDRRLTEVDLDIEVTGLLSEHNIIQNRVLKLSVDEFLQKLDKHRQEFIPNYHRFLDLRHTSMERERKLLRLNEFRPRPLSSFVRNKLINDAYLPIIGDNLAKQMGTVGDEKRTDLMGLLMMISPPGYGKTTLMEYVANRLGLIFMKINCPSLGHEVLSLDPEQAPNATAAQELVKLNLALEMGNNVMLYLDDIQHTHPEFLQKFISLCDGTRRIEGIWKGGTKTYDMRGKKFCVVMAGNPYTESGELFKIPDMLANRADIYNLGDILGGMDEQFALSYIENALTSNAVVAPLATREQEDVYRLVKMAAGDGVASTDLSHQYSAAELNEIIQVIQKLFQIRDVVLAVNKEYIRSAAQADQYRIEPAFKLQGSYRNMNKMAEKVTAVMNNAELKQLIADHYLGEAQLLTIGAEENLLKLKELLNDLSEAEEARWAQIKEDFLRNKNLGGEDADTGTQIVAQLMDLNKLLGEFRSLSQEKEEGRALPELGNMLSKLSQVIDSLSKRENFNKSEAEKQEQFTMAMLDKMKSIVASAKPEVEVINQPVPGLDKLLQALTHSIETSLYPIVHSMEKKLEIDLRTHHKMEDISNQMREIEKNIQQELAQEKRQFKELKPKG